MRHSDSTESLWHIMVNVDAETKQRTIRLDVEIDNRLTEYARRTRRTVNAAVNVLLGEALERQQEAERARGTPKAGATP